MHEYQLILGVEWELTRRVLRRVSLAKREKMTDHNWQKYHEFSLVMIDDKESFIAENEQALIDFDLILDELFSHPEFGMRVKSSLLAVTQKASHKSEPSEITVRLMLPGMDPAVENLNPSWGFFIIEKHLDETVQTVVELFLYQEGS